MHLLFLRMLLTFLMLHVFVRTSHQAKRCGCVQCNHINGGLRRCECCVYFLHGKRSSHNKQAFHTLETSETDNNLDIYSMDKRLVPDLLSEGVVNKSPSDKVKIITSNYLDEATRSYLRKEPLNMKLTEFGNNGDDEFSGTNIADNILERVLGIFDKNEQPEEDIVYVI